MANQYSACGTQTGEGCTLAANVHVSMSHWATLLDRDFLRDCVGSKDTPALSIILSTETHKVLSMSTASRRRAANKAASQGMTDIPAAKTTSAPATSQVTVPTEVIEVEIAAQPVSHIDNVFNKSWLRKTQTAIVKSIKKDGEATKRETFYPQLVLWPSGKLACRASTTLAALH